MAAVRPHTARPFSGQVASGGTSVSQIGDAALACSRPERGLRWLDVGCGSGRLLRRIRDEWEPAELWGIDVIDWLDDDLRADVKFDTRPAERVGTLPSVDRVLLVEVIEHLEAPWSTLRAAARLLAPGGRLVVSTPNLARLRNRLELAVRGQLVAFRPDNAPHLTPALPHVTSRVLGEEGLIPEAPRFAGRDVISLTKGRVWPESVRSRYPRLISLSVLVAAARPW